MVSVVSWRMLSISGCSLNSDGGEAVTQDPGHLRLPWPGVRVTKDPWSKQLSGTQATRWSRGSWGDQAQHTTRPQTPGLSSGTRLFIRRTNESGQDSAKRSQTWGWSAEPGVGPKESRQKSPMSGSKESGLRETSQQAPSTLLWAALV